MDIINTRFANGPILAKLAAHIASSGTETEDRCAGEKMMERLFFDRINTETCGLAVACGYKFSAHILPDVAKSALPFTDSAKSRTKSAGNFSLFAGMPPARGMYLFT